MYVYLIIAYLLFNTVYQSKLLLIMYRYNLYNGFNIEKKKLLLIYV